jgi:16S rRNA U1498 N3-methylase RsmE
VLRTETAALFTLAQLIVLAGLDQKD